MADFTRMGRNAQILYRGGILGEEPIDESAPDKPFSVMIGARQIPKGIDNALLEMEIGEERTIVIPPELGYGDYSPKKRSWYPRMMLGNGYQLKVGSMALCNTEKGDGTVPGTVVNATQDAVEIDFNHPLAGKTLQYWVKLVAIV